MSDNKFKIPSTDVPIIDSGRSITSTLTGESFPYNRHKSGSRRAAIEAAQDAGATVIDANNERAGRKLTIREHQAMLEGKFNPDPRSLVERILQDGSIKDNHDKTEDEISGVSAATAAELQDDRFWGVSKPRLAAREKLREHFQSEFESRQQELAEQAAKEEREMNPDYREAIADASLALSLKRANPNSTESELAEHLDRYEQLQTGELSPAAYFDIVAPKGEQE